MIPRFPNRTPSEFFGVSSFLWPGMSVLPMVSHGFRVTVRISFFLPGGYAAIQPEMLIFPMVLHAFEGASRFRFFADLLYTPLAT